MILRIFFLILGFFLMIVGLAHIIVYTNLLTFGYTVKEYFSYLVTRYECWYFIVGFLIEAIVILRKEKKNVKCI